MTAPLDADEFGRWRAQADSARDAAEAARSVERYDWACFLYEQSAQLGIEGLLHAFGFEAWGHDLASLGSRTRGHLGEDWPSDLAEPAARLSRHYIPARYPDAHASGAPSDHYTPGDASQARDDAASLISAVDAAWSMVQAGDE